MRSINWNQAFTGLEAAIVLIAFVVVAAVFAYVVLGAGFFTTQKSQEVVHTGVQQASTNLAILGEVYGDGSGSSQDNTGPDRVHTFIFTVGLSSGGSPIDMNRTTLIFSNSTTLQNLDFSTSAMAGSCAGTSQPVSNQWAICSKTNADTDNVLEPNEKFTIQANVSMGAIYGQLGTPSQYGVPVRDAFTIEIKPELGASLGIARKGPGSIDPMNLLY